MGIPHTTDIEVGTRIRQQRKAIGLTQEKLGRLLGITFQQIQKYERGSNRVGASRLLDIARVLGVDVAYFFSESAQAHKPAGEIDDLTLFISTSEGRSLNNAFSKIDDETVKRKIVALVRAIAQCESAEHSING